MTHTPLPAPLHDRLTVVRADAGVDATDMARRLAGGLVRFGAAGAAVDLRPAPGTGAVVDADDIRRAATARATAAHGERTAARDRAVAHRTGLATRRTHLLERAEWCEATAGAARALTSARAAAEAAAAAARADVDEAASRRDRVAAQRAAAQAAVEEANLELEGLDGSSLDETGVRRELEAATRAERDANAAFEAAEAELSRLRARLVELDAARDELVPLRDELAAPRTTSSTESAFELAVADALAFYDDLAMRNGPDRRARELADNLEAADRQLREMRATVAEPPTDGQIQGAEADVAAARRRIDNRRAAASSFDGPPPPWWIELNGLHAQVVDAETALQTGGLRKGGIRKRYEDAIAAERARLDELGFGSYLDALMSGGRLPEDRAGDEDAVAALTDALAKAEEQLEQLWNDRVAGAPLITLIEEHGRLLKAATTVLGCDPDGRGPTLLREHPNVPESAVAVLADALRSAGVPTTGIGVAAAARAWLATRVHDHDPARLADVERRLATIIGERHTVEQAIAPAAMVAERASVAATAANRTVASLESELPRARAGDDSRLLDRAVAARSLRDQVQAVETRLAQAESDALEAWAATGERLAITQAECDRLEQELSDLSRRATRAAAELPPQRRPAFDLVAGMVPLAGALRAEAATLAELLADAEAAVAEAEAAAASGPDEPSAADLVEGLVAAVESAARSRAGGPVVLAEPLRGCVTEAVEPVLCALAEASADVPVVVVTTDLEVVGWAIGLPSTQGSLVAARSIQELLAPASSTNGHHRPAHPNAPATASHSPTPSSPQSTDVD